MRRAKSFLSQTIRGLPESYTGSTPNLSPLAPICSHSEPSTSEGRHTPKGRLKGRDDRATHGRFLDIVVGSARRTASLLRTGRRGSEDCKCGKRFVDGTEASVGEFGEC